MTNDEMLAEIERLRALPPHGTTARYRSQPCRCDKCRHANTVYQKRYRMRTRASGKGVPSIPVRVDREPVVRHYRALMASGWTSADIADVVGISRSALQRKMCPSGYRYIVRHHADAILALEPLAELTDYIDPVRVDRLVAGYPDAPWPTGTTRPERLAALARLDYRDTRSRLGTGKDLADLPSMRQALAYLGLRSDDAAALKEAS